MNKRDREAIRDLAATFSDSKLTSLEASKKLIVSRSPLVPPFLRAIAARLDCPRHARLAAVYALGFIGDPSSVSVLSAILRDSHQSVAVRSHAAEALGNIRDRSALVTLVDVLKADAPPSLRFWCVYALGEIGGALAEKVLRELIRAEPSYRVKKEAKESLMKLGRGRNR